MLTKYKLLILTILVTILAVAGIAIGSSLATNNSASNVIDLGNGNFINTATGEYKTTDAYTGSTLEGRLVNGEQEEGYYTDQYVPVIRAGKLITDIVNTEGEFVSGSINKSDEKGYTTWNEDLKINLVGKTNSTGDYIEGFTFKGDDELFFQLRKNRTTEFSFPANLPQISLVAKYALFAIEKKDQAENNDFVAAEVLKEIVGEIAITSLRLEKEFGKAANKYIVRGDINVLSSWVDQSSNDSSYVTTGQWDGANLLFELKIPDGATAIKDMTSSLLSDSSNRAYSTFMSGKLNKNDYVMVLWNKPSFDVANGSLFSGLLKTKDGKYLQFRMQLQAGSKIINVENYQKLMEIMLGGVDF